MPILQPKTATCLWFDNQAEDAATFYVDTFRACGQDAAINETLLYGEAGPGPKGSILTVTFNLAGQEYVGLNGGPHFTFSPATSLMVKCADQAEVDAFWDKLIAGGGPQQCGWLTDKFGLSWQVVPVELYDMLRDANPARSDRVMAAMMQMIKIDIDALKKVYAAG